MQSILATMTKTREKIHRKFAQALTYIVK